MTNLDASYVGSELELFQFATNWKRYYGAMLTPYLGARILEVGAGIGGTTSALCTGSHDSWVCLEPDNKLCSEIDLRIERGELPDCCSAVCGTLASVQLAHQPDTLLYIDVLEHIEEDRLELERAAAHLGPQGRIIILAPAHNWLFSEFDAAVGHYRRYNVSMLKEIVPSGMSVVLERYLDSCGTLLSFANRVVAKKSVPNATNIRFWDTCVVPVSRVVDRMLGYHFGKSVLVVLEKNA